MTLNSDWSGQPGDEQIFGSEVFSSPLADSQFARATDRLAELQEPPWIQTVAPPEMMSDDFRTDGILNSSRGTFELKFVVDEGRAAAVSAWAREQLDPDPHAERDLGDGYYVSSLYLDTPGFDVYHRSGFFSRRKFRLRRYGSESTVWLELKSKRQGRVRKRRIPVATAELASRLTPSDDNAWEGAWFRQWICEQRLGPVCRINYQRFARVGRTAEGPIRLTIDSGLRACEAASWDVAESPRSATQMLNSQRIVEFKFRETLPASFRALIQDLELQVTAFSKYRAGVDACLPLPPTGSAFGGSSDA